MSQAPRNHPPVQPALARLAPAKRAWLATGAVLTSACGSSGGPMTMPSYTYVPPGLAPPTDTEPTVPQITVTFPKLPGVRHVLSPGSSLGMDSYYAGHVQGTALVPGVDVAVFTWPDGCTMQVTLQGGSLAPPEACTREEDEQDDDRDFDQDDDDERDSDSRDESQRRNDPSSNGGGGGGGGGLLQPSLLTTTGTIIGTTILTKTLIDQVQDDDDTDDTPPVSP